MITFPPFSLFFCSRSRFSLVFNTTDYSPGVGKVTVCRLHDLHAKTPKSGSIQGRRICVSLRQPLFRNVASIGTSFLIEQAGYMHALEEESSVPMHHDRPRQEADDEQHRVVAYQIQTSVGDGTELVLGATILLRFGPAQGTIQSRLLVLVCGYYCEIHPR
jgi:hypothetical protein